MRVLFVLSFVLGCSILFGQTKQNEINSFANKKEKYWLKNQNIDLFKVPLNDKMFATNVSKSISLNESYKDETAKYSAFLAGGVFGILTGIGTAIAGKSNQTNAILGGLGLGCTVMAININKKRKKTKVKLKDQLDLTRSQYQLLLKN